MPSKYRALDLSLCNTIYMYSGKKKQFWENLHKDFSGVNFRYGPGIIKTISFIEVLLNNLLLLMIHIYFLGNLYLKF